ncbi:transposase [Streptomyces sp. 900105755]
MAAPPDLPLPPAAPRPAAPARPPRPHRRRGDPLPHLATPPPSARRPLLLPAQQNLLDELTALAGHTPGWQPRITDHAWQILSPLLPPLPHHGGRRRSERQLLEAILHITCTHQPWTQLPHALGPFQACLRRYHRWLSNGTLTRITHTPLPETDQHWQHRLATHLDQTARRSG